MKLLGTGNPKTMKGQKKGFLTFILHLAPGNLSGFNVCPGASLGCLGSCLNLSGRGRFDKIQAARIRKTRWFFEDRDSFMLQLVKDIQAGIRKAERENLTPVFRLNGTSDIRWENYSVTDFIGQTFPNIFDVFSDYQFYDYTKLSNRRNIPRNYHLTFSRSESNDIDVDTVLMSGVMNVAVVFSTPKKGDLPLTFRSVSVVDGDDTDLRFLDGTGKIVGLRAKGDAKKDTSGFVINV